MKPMPEKFLALMPTWLHGFVARGKTYPLHVALQQVYA